LKQQSLHIKNEAAIAESENEVLEMGFSSVGALCLAQTHPLGLTKTTSDN
jgi:hypothetical protein